jgi:iron complex transport system substrate-binding protein
MKIWIWLTFLVLVFGCKPKIKINRNKIASIIPYAKYLKVREGNGFVEVKIINPDTEEVEKTLILVPRNQGKPAVTSSSEIIQVPIKGMICLSATQIGMMDKLNCLSKIKGVSSIKYVYNPDLINAYDKGKIIEVSRIQEMNTKRILESKADVICYSGFGQGPPTEKTLLKVGIHSIPIYDWRENHPLGKLAWIYLISYLTGKEENAKHYFSFVAKRYNQLAKKAKQNKSKSSVLAGSLIGDSWYLPAGESYSAKLLKDAGATYVAANSKGSGSLAISLEKCLKSYKNASIWINPGHPSKNELLLASKHYGLFTAFKTGNLFCYTHNSNFFWESSVTEPHKLLSDIIQLTQASNKSANKLYFYKKLVP